MNMNEHMQKIEQLGQPKYERAKKLVTYGLVGLLALAVGGVVVEGIKNVNEHNKIYQEKGSSGLADHLETQHPYK